jgi:hypothetical protein
LPRSQPFFQTADAGAERADLDKLRGYMLRDVNCLKAATMNLALTISAAEMDANTDSPVVSSQWLHTLSDLYIETEWRAWKTGFPAIIHKNQSSIQKQIRERRCQLRPRLNACFQSEAHPRSLDQPCFFFQSPLLPL